MYLSLVMRYWFGTSNVNFRSFDVWIVQNPIWMDQIVNFIIPNGLPILKMYAHPLIRSLQDTQISEWPWWPWYGTGQYPRDVDWNVFYRLLYASLSSLFVDVIGTTPRFQRVSAIQLSSAYHSWRINADPQNSFPPIIRPGGCEK